MRAHTFPVAEADSEVRLRFQAHDCPLHETLRVHKKLQKRAFPVAETDGEVSSHFQARACLQDHKGLEDERGRSDASAVQKEGGGRVTQRSEKLDFWT